MLIKKEDFKEELENQYTILIKAEERQNKKRTIILYIISSVTLLMTIISLITVFISLNNTRKESTKLSQPKTVYQTLVTNYNGDNTLNLSAIGNGYYLQNPKIITISNEGDTSLTYNIKITNIQTSLLSTNNLVYTITKDSEVSSPKELPLSETKILDNIKVTPGETITYKIDAKFNGVLEEGNYTNYYNSQIIVEQNNDKANLLN